MGEMNVRTVKKSVVLSVLCLGGTACLSGCASNMAADMSSPFAAEVQSIVDSRTAYPQLADFPASPVDVPSPESIAQKVSVLETTQTTLASNVRGIEWQLNESPEVTAAEIRALLQNMPVDAPTAQTPAEIEAFAQSLRDRAKAPPPVDRPMR